MNRFAMLAAAATLAAAPALAQVNPGAERPATGMSSTGGNAEQNNKPAPNTGSTAGGPTARGGSMADQTGTVAPSPMAAPNRGMSDPAAAGNAAQTGKPVPNTGTVSGGPAAAR